MSTLADVNSMMQSSRILFQNSEEPPEGFLGRVEALEQQLIEAVASEQQVEVGELLKLPANTVLGAKAQNHFDQLAHMYGLHAAMCPR